MLQREASPSTHSSWPPRTGCSNPGSYTYPHKGCLRYRNTIPVSVLCPRLPLLAQPPQPRQPDAQVDEAGHLLLGPREGVDEEYRHAFASGDIQKSLQLLPPGRSTELSLLKSFRSHPGNMRAAARRIPRPLRKMYYSAYQSELFNWVLIERMMRSQDGFHMPWGGDICQLEGRRSRFHVETDPVALERERERARAGEISPTGPIFGRKMKLPTGVSGQIEAQVLESEGLRPESWLSHVKGLDLDGSRRPWCQTRASTSR